MTKPKLGQNTNKIDVKFKTKHSQDFLFFAIVIKEIENNNQRSEKVGFDGHSRKCRKKISVRSQSKQNKNKKLGNLCAVDLENSSESCCCHVFLKRESTLSRVDFGAKTEQGW